MAYQNQYAGAGGLNGEAQQQPRPRPPLQSQYFQSYDLSHATQPAGRRRPTYTAQQKADAIQLLNEGKSPHKIAERIGGSCSHSNPDRWRSEVRERRRRRYQAAVTASIQFIRYHLRTPRYLALHWALLFLAMEISIVLQLCCYHGIDCVAVFGIWFFARKLARLSRCRDDTFHIFVLLIFVGVTEITLLTYFLPKPPRHRRRY